MINISKTARVSWINKYQFDNREIARAKTEREYPIGTLQVLSTILSYAVLSASIFWSKYVYSIKKISSWEDVYGECLVGIILSYFIMRYQRTSPFEIYSHMRSRLICMEICFVSAVLLIMYGIQQVSILTSTSALIMYFVFSDYHFGITNIFILFALAGLLILANPFGIIVEGQNQEVPIVCLAIGAVFFVVARHSSDYMKQWVTLASGIFYYNLISILIVPVWIIIFLSLSSGSISYGFYEIGYFLVNGTVFWVSIWMIIRTFQHDSNHYLELVAYSIVLFAIWFQTAYLKYKESSDVQEHTQNPSPEPHSEQPEGGLIEAQLGAWEYFGITIMIGLRFLYAIYKVVRYCKSKHIVEKEEESYSFSELE